MREPEVYMVAGEAEPFLQGTKKCFERIGRIVANHGVKILSCLTFAYGKEITRSDSFVLSLAIPASKIKDVERDLVCSLTHHPGICIGNSIAQPARWKDVDGSLYASPYPSKAHASNTIAEQTKASI